MADHFAPQVKTYADVHDLSGTIAVAGIMVTFRLAKHREASQNGEVVIITGRAK